MHFVEIEFDKVAQIQEIFGVQDELIKIIERKLLCSCRTQRYRTYHSEQQSKSNKSCPSTYYVHEKSPGQRRSRECRKS